MASGGLFSRMWRAALLQSSLFEEVEADTKANNQAIIVVALVSLAAGIGRGIGAVVGGNASVTGFIWGLVGGIVSSLLVWFIFSLLCFWLGTSLFKGPNTKATLGELLRTLGFAYSPGVLNILALIPVVGGIIPFATLVWTAIAAVIAVRQACDFTTGKAVGTVIVALIIPVVLLILLGVLIGGSCAALMSQA
jgi:hypothetical protein